MLHCWLRGELRGSDDGKGIRGNALGVVDEVHGLGDCGDGKASLVGADFSKRNLADFVVLVICEDAVGDDELVGVDVEFGLVVGLVALLGFFVFGCWDVRSVFGAGS